MKTTETKKGGLAKSFNIQKFLAPAALIILYLFFCIFGKNFASLNTLITILDSTYFVALLAFGLTFIIITAGIDLSCGTVMMCAAVIGGYAYNMGLPIWLSLIVVIIIATLFGLLNGFLVAKCKLPPFIATLGVMMMSQGVGSIATKVTTQTFPSSFEADGWYKSIFYKTPDGFPSGAVFVGVCFIIALILLNKTRFGRYAFAIGSNEEAVRLSGVNVVFWKTIIYIVSGVFVGLAALVYASTYSTIIPGSGAGMETKAIASVIIGGTSMSGGIGTMSGTLIGALLMSVLTVGLMSMGFQAHYQLFFTGLVVILAVLLDIYRNKKSS